MIEFTKAYIVNGKPYASLPEAQIAELDIIFAGQENVSGLILSNSEKIMNILSTTTKSRPGARKANGAKKTRKAKMLVLDPAAPITVPAAIAAPGVV